MNWIYLAKDRDQRRALVNTVMNILVYKRKGIPYPPEWL
jgi:hypothetical protein